METGTNEREYLIWSDWKLESMLDKTSFTETQKDDINNKWYSLFPCDNEFSFDEIVMLQDKIIRHVDDPITTGRNYGQNDIVRKLNWIK